MAKARRGVCAHSDALRSLLVEFCALDDGLDDLLLVSPLFVVAPPNRPLVLALETKMFAGAASQLSLIALLAS